MKIAVVGATGLVGNKMMEVLAERNFPLDELIPVASEKSIGKKVTCNKKQYTVIGIQEAIDLNPDIALFSAGGETSLKHAPLFANKGTHVIDNSSAWRMDPGIKLIVPEINASELTKGDKIIANPNCSTIQLVMVLAPLHKKYTIKRVVVSTYQSVTGSGMKAALQLENERKGLKGEQFYPHTIDKNIIPHCDEFQEGGYTKEEWKLVNETRKILDDKSIQLTATTVRVPVTGGHGESVNVEFKKPFQIEDIKDVLNLTTGIVVEDEPDKNIYPMPLNAMDKDDVFVGRIRRDLSIENGLNLWIVSDNLRKGAATNAVQIAEYVRDKFR
jgi:aspartate-semialdehyde dehydrogenase